MKKLNISYIDFIPALSGLIGKIALTSSFAMVWSQELGITKTNFVLENVRAEVLIGSIITLIVSIMSVKIAPAGTLAPLIIMIPVMSTYGVHPLVLGVLVGVVGILVIRTGLFKYLLDLAGTICKTSITLVFGISGIWMSLINLYRYFSREKLSFWIIVLVLLSLYSIMLYVKKGWMIIPVAASVSFLIPQLFDKSYRVIPQNLHLNLNPFYWWDTMWGIGFGLNGLTILKTIPFAFFVILLWTIDTLSIQTVRESNTTEEKEEQHDFVKSFYIVAIRNTIGAFIGGAQTGSLWRSFLIPLYMMKRPFKNCAMILGILGIIASLTLLPIQILSYTPLVWSVLLFGIFIPFTITAGKNIINEKRFRTKVVILLFAGIGMILSPILTWIVSVFYEKMIKKK